MNELMSASVESFSSRCQKVLQVARQLYAGKPDWVTFFRETLGVNGAARSVFQSQEEYVQFEQSSEFAEIQKLVGSLRTRRVGSKNEPTRVITVRLPESLHEALKAEASDHNTSMNKLCISKLLQVLVENEKQPAQSGSVAGRRNTLPIPAQTTHPTAGSIGSASNTLAAPASPNFRSTFGQTGSESSAIRKFGQ